MAGRRIERHERKYEYVYKYRKEILFVVVLASLLFAAYVVAQTFYAPTVEVSTETPLAEGAGGTIIVPAVMTNESEEDNGIPEWWHWSKEDWQKFQRYANETEVIWTYNEQGEKIGGKVIVAGEPLWSREHKYVGLGLYDYGPVKYLDGNRTGICGEVRAVCYRLFKARGENVRIARARNNNTGKLHDWTEIEVDGEWYVINYDQVIPLGQWTSIHNYYKEVKRQTP